MSGEAQNPSQDSLIDDPQINLENETEAQKSEEKSSDPIDQASRDLNTASTSLDKDPTDSLDPVDINQESDPKPSNNEARLEQLEKEHETLRSQYMRIAADFDNFRKRQSRDQDDLRMQLTCNTLSEILPVVDNFERARQQLEPEGEEAQALHRSYQGLYKQLVDIFKQLGVAPMRVVGQSFDPSLHEAVMREPSNDQPEDIIIEELQRGYHLNGRVLRHALVKVSMGPGPQKEESIESHETMKEAVSNEDELSSTQGS